MPTNVRVTVNTFNTARKNFINILRNRSEQLQFANTCSTPPKPPTIDIYSKNPYPSCALSNFRRCEFVFKGVKCHSIEGVIQSLKVIIPSPKENYQLYRERIELQKKVCGYANSKAKRMGNFLNFFNPKRELNWQGHPINRFTNQYQEFLKSLYETKYLANAEFRAALEDSKNCQLTHSIGKRNKADTNLTAQEFIGMLQHLRTKFHIK